MYQLLTIAYRIKDTFWRACLIAIFFEVVIAIFSKKRNSIYKQIGKVFLNYLFFQYLFLISRLTGIDSIGISSVFSYIRRGYYAGIQFGFDSLSHFLQNIIMYIPMGILLPSMFKKISDNYKLVFTILCLSSLVIELLQGVIGRCSDVSDVLANFIGGVFGYLIYCYIIKRKRVHLYICNLKHKEEQI